MTVRQVMTDADGQNYVQGFIVEMTSFDYDDNHYFQQDGYSIIERVYATREAAEKMAFDQNVISVNEMLDDPHSWFSNGFAQELSEGSFQDLERLFWIIKPEKAFKITGSHDEVVAMDILNDCTSFDAPSNKDEYAFVMRMLPITKKAHVTPVQVEI